MGTRKNASTLTADEKRRYVNAVLQMKRTPLTPGHSHLSRPGAEENVYDKYVAWHLGESFAPTPIIHESPLFLPWHRYFIRLFELDLQQADRDWHAHNPHPATVTPAIGTITLPYWDFCQYRSPASTATGSIWTTDFMGAFPTVERDRRIVTTPANPTAPDVPFGEVTDGPFAGSTNWPIFLNVPPIRYRSRSAGGTARDFPDTLQRSVNPQVILTDLPYIRAVVGEMPIPGIPGGLTVYDSPPWDDTVPAAASFRNTLEGGAIVDPYDRTATPPPPPAPIPPQLHNRTHPWIGGHQGIVPTSVNDPSFFLLHANVDRYWAYWQYYHPTRAQYPPRSSSYDPRLWDYMSPWDSNPALRKRPIDVLNHRRLGYMYDVEPPVPRRFR